MSQQALAGLFGAAATLQRAAPWSRASEAQVLRLDIAKLGIAGACVSIVGAPGEAREVRIFPSLEAYESFVRACQATPGADSAAHGSSDLLALTYARGADLPAALRRQVTKHSWPVADASSYPRVVRRGGDGQRRPLVEDDVRVASTCALALAAFCRKHPEIFESASIEPLCESYTDRDGVTVRFTVPYDAFPLFDVDSRGPRRSVGRGDPCPCGSGAKYKHCHMEADRRRARTESAIAALHDMDVELVFAMTAFAHEHFGEEWLRFERDFAPGADVRQLALPWSVYHYPVRGFPVVEWYLHAEGRYLSRTERDWLEAQRRVWLSVWRPTDAQPGESLTLHDVLSGERRIVQENLGSRDQLRDLCVLARVVEHDGVALICGLHPRPLPASAALEVAERVCARIHWTGLLPVERLRDPQLGGYLIRRWEEAAIDLRRASLAPKPADL